MEGPIPISVILKHYKRPEIQEEMVWSARNREVAVRFDKIFGKRPDVLSHARDVLEFAKQRASSFHVSEERWSNPLAISAEMRPNDLAEMRTGWDLVLDIDCPIVEWSKIAGKLCIDFLRAQGIKSISIKFSGNKGFHIGVPFEAFPQKVSNRDVRDLFPDAPRRIARYIFECIKEKLIETIIRYEGNISKVLEKIGRDYNDLVQKKEGFLGGTGKNEFLINEVLEIDTILISSRHLYRMPYSLHEKSGLVSLPIDPDEVILFEKKQARPEVVEKSKFRFLDTSIAKKEEARSLFIQAFDYTPKETEEFELSEKTYEIPQEAIPDLFFPSCIKKMLQGLKDGRKRALFVLIAFLSNCGWGWDQIEDYLTDWNEKNQPPLRDNNIVSQVRYRKLQKKLIMPPNFDNKSYYDDIGCSPDEITRKLKNPVNYAKMRARNHTRDSKKPKKTKDKPKSSVTNDNAPKNTKPQPL